MNVSIEKNINELHQKPIAYYHHTTNTIHYTPEKGMFFDLQYP